MHQEVFPLNRLLCLSLALLLCTPFAFAESTASLTPITIAEPVHLIGYLPLYVAIHEGYFAEEGLDVTVVQATGGAHVTAVGRSARRQAVFRHFSCSFSIFP